DFLVTAKKPISRVASQKPRPSRTCLVLSVGAAKGIAHIGAIDALKEEKVKIDCVYGNSMGAVIGSLYASAPSADLKQRYRVMMAEYFRLTKAETVDNALAAALVVAILSGGTLGWQGLAGSAFVGGASVPKIDNNRF